MSISPKRSKLSSSISMRVGELNERNAKITIKTRIFTIETIFEWMIRLVWIISISIYFNFNFFNLKMMIRNWIMKWTQSHLKRNSNVSYVLPCYRNQEKHSTFAFVHMHIWSKMSSILDRLALALFFKSNIANVNKSMDCHILFEKFWKKWDAYFSSFCALSLSRVKIKEIFWQTKSIEKNKMHSAEEIKQQTVRGILNLPQNPNGLTLRELNGK